VLAGGAYKECHDKIAINLHWHLCGKHNLSRSEFCWNHSPPVVIEIDDVKVLWDFNIFTDHVISTRRPDIVVVDKHLCRIMLIDVAIPSYFNVDDKETEKITKYQDLRMELERL